MSFKKKMVDGKEHLVATVEFDLGEIKQEKRETVNGHTAISMPVGVRTSMMIYKETIKNMIKQDDMEGFETYLEDYAKLYLNDVIGVESYPIRYDATGNIKGIKEEVTVDE